MLHAIVIALALAVPWRSEGPPSFFTLVPPTTPQPRELPPYGGTRPGRGPSGGLGRPVPVAPAPTLTPPAPIGRPDSALAASPSAVGPHIVTVPQLADGRLWVPPRPALPTNVADALYGPQEPRDTVAVQRLRAMVDSLNQIIDQEQRAGRRPSWVATVEGAKFGIDSQYIHVAGIKIPTAVLALLPITLPQGNYDEARRARQLEDMRQDLMQAARRTETLYLFRQYVRELRARKQAEHDAEQRAQDSTKARGDSTKAIP